MKGNGIINERLHLLADELAYLKSERDAVNNFYVYQENVRLKKAIERSLQVAIEICFDISQRIISENGLRFAKTYSETFLVLQEEGIVSQRLGENLQNMASFRNLIVHDYVKIDDEQVYANLKKHLGDFDAFAAAIVQYLTNDLTPHD